MKKNLKIMEASGSDVPRVANFLVERFHKEYEDWYPPVDVERSIAYIGDHWEHGKIFICLDGDNIVGVTMAKPIPYWFSRSSFLNEGVFYVAPEARRTKAASMLVDALKTLAETLDLDLMLSTNTGSRLKAKERFFESKGLHRIGTMHVLRK
jgi:GNAT superfamily N-acetyltransferase